MGTAVVISSCDQFRDAWAPFFHFFFKQWPDCPYPVYLLTNYGMYKDDRVITVAVGPDRAWADNLVTAFGRIKEDTILYLQEDYFLTRPVRTAELVEDCAFMKARNLPYLGLYPSAAPEETPFEGHARYNLLPARGPMRASLQAALWNREALLALMRRGEDGWDMEREGTERSRSLVFLRVKSCAASPMDYFCTAIKRGLWEPEAVQMCRDAGVVLDLNFRPVRPETKGQRFRRKWRLRLDRWRERLFPRPFDVYPASR